MRRMDLLFFCLSLCRLCCGSSAVAEDVAVVAGTPAATAASPAPPKLYMPLGAPKKPVVAAPLGKPKFALKMGAGSASSGAAPARDAEVQRLIGRYEQLAVEYYSMLIKAQSAEEKAAITAKHEPNERVLRPFVRLLSNLVAEDPTDAPALEALLFISKYVGVPEIDKVLAATPIKSGAYEADHLNPQELIVAFHVDNAKIGELLKKSPPGSVPVDYLRAVFDKTHRPENRAAAGMLLISGWQQAKQPGEAERIAAIMSEDRYLDGVPVASGSSGPTARTWAAAKLRELQVLAIGKVLPEVGATKLDGTAATISDYRGKVVVLDVWTTWCGPCVAMIPHETEMVARLAEKPFALISVSCDEERATLEEFLLEHEMPWEHWWAGTNSDLAKALNISAYPTVIVLDAEGTIRFKNLKGEELEQAVESLLKELE